MCDSESKREWLPVFFQVDLPKGLVLHQLVGERERTCVRKRVLVRQEKGKKQKKTRKSLKMDGAGRPVVVLGYRGERGSGFRHVFLREKHPSVMVGGCGCYARYSSSKNRGGRERGDKKCHP